MDSKDFVDLKTLAGSLAMLVLLTAGAANAQASSADEALALENAVYQCIEPLLDGTYEPPIFSGLGDTDYPFEIGALDSDPVSAREAQVFFNQGMNLFYGFNHPEAALSFAEAAARVPEDPMPYWGVAMSVGPDINTVPDPICSTVAAKAAELAAQVARTQCANAAQGACEAGSRDPARVESLLTEALSVRYSDFEKTSLLQRNQAYAGRMEALVAEFPELVDAHVLAAAAQMDICPWQWWLKPGQSDCLGFTVESGDHTQTYPTTQIEIATAHIERALQLYPRHLGARHYHIHAVEESPSPERALRTAEMLAELGPGMGHIVHMPSHIFRRTGRHDLASNYNYRSVAVDAAYVAQVPNAARYLLHYLSHDRHFLMVSLGFEGRRSETLAMADILSDGAVSFGRHAYELRPKANLSMAEVKPDYFFTSALWALARFSSSEPMDVVDGEDIECALSAVPPVPDRAWTSPYRYLINKVMAGQKELAGASDGRIQFPSSTLAAHYTYLMGLAVNPDVAASELSACFAGLMEVKKESDAVAQGPNPHYAGYGNNPATRIYALMKTVLLARIAERLERAGDEDAAAALVTAHLPTPRAGWDDPLGPPVSPACVTAADSPSEQAWLAAVGMEDRLYYNEPDDWYYPIRESLGSAYYADSDYSCALATFNRDLLKHPRNPRSVFGLAQTQRALGDSASADRLMAEFETLWNNAQIRMTMDMLR